MNKITQAVILSAGLGMRLRSLFPDIPKVMVPLVGKSLLEHHILDLKKYGVNEFCLNLHYLPEVIKNYFGDGSKFGIRIHYALETPEILGTGGGVKNFENVLGENFIVLYGDTFYKINYGRLFDFYASLKDPVGMNTVRKTDHPLDSDLAVVDKNARLVRFLIKPHKELPQEEYWGSSAPYILAKKSLAYVPPRKYFEIAHNLIPALLAEGHNFYSYKLPEGDFRKDIGTPERYKEVEEYLRKAGFRG